MLGVIVNLFSGIIGLLTSLLPLSPFKDAISSLPEWTDTALGWLNWLIPVQACLNFFLLWLTALLITTALSLILDFAKNFGDRV